MTAKLVSRRMLTVMKIARGQAILSIFWVLRSLARATRQRPMYWKLIARQVGRYKLFDQRYYLETNGDVSGSDYSPEFHFAAYGDRESRHPLPLFDPAYYRSQVRGRLVKVNSLVHYALIGRYKAISPSPWFDLAYYLANNKDVARSGKDPLHHYLYFGGFEGRSPSKHFDGAHYLRANPDVVLGGLHPLLHYLKFGRLEDRPIQPLGDACGDQANQPNLLPTQESWDSCVIRRVGTDAKIDVIIPVYRGRAETLRCILSVLKAKAETPFELIIIDDASPDEDLTSELKDLASRGLFTLLHNSRNLGFVATVNRGMALHPDRDIVLLNADTEVYNDWLDRLAKAAYRTDRTGTVTPLSNNATICSYPEFLHDNPYPLEIPYTELDRLTAEVNRDAEVETPTGVGFCMYIRRACLEEAGPFDAETFRQGYGEENDFCQRAIGYGWRNVIAADVFVRHLGAVSFAGEKGRHLSRAMIAIARLHPNYHEDVRRFIRDDPLKAARERLDWARITAGARQRNVLMVCHNRGGGAERHLQEDAQREIKQGNGVFYLRPQRGDPSHVRLFSAQVTNAPNMPVFRLEDVVELGRRLKELRISLIHNHGMVDFEMQAPSQLSILANEVGVPYRFDIHDYKVICPRINLVDRNGRYCGEPDEEGCNRCLRTAGNDFGADDIRKWRDCHHDALMGANSVFVPDEDVAQRLSRYFPDVKFTVSPHEDADRNLRPIRRPVLEQGQPLRIAVIGAIGKIKGYDVLHACSLDAKTRNLPLEFVLMGYSLDDRALSRAGVTVTGRYLDTEAEVKLRELDPHAVWLPSLWPETYSYTLSLALALGYPVFAFDLGAIAGRLNRLARGQYLMPLHILGNSAQINERFLNLMRESANYDVRKPIAFHEKAS